MKYGQSEAPIWLTSAALKWNQELHEKNVLNLEAIAMRA